MYEKYYLRKAIFPLLLATPLILLTMVVIPTQQAYAQEAGIGIGSQCSNGDFAHWVDEDGTPKDIITYKIIVKAPSIPETQIDAVREGIERWDGFVHNIEEVGANEDADIDVTLAIRAQFENKEFVEINKPAHRLYGFGTISWDDNCNAVSGTVDLSMKGVYSSRAVTTGLANLAEHEFGHALSLAHSDYEQDIMSSTKPGTRQLWIQQDICPSNLDVEALTAEVRVYFVEDWEELSC